MEQGRKINPRGIMEDRKMKIKFIHNNNDLLGNTRRGAYFPNGPYPGITGRRIYISKGLSTFRKVIVITHELLHCIENKYIDFLLDGKWFNDYNEIKEERKCLL